MPGIQNRMLSFIRHPKDGGAQTVTRGGGSDSAAQVQQQKQNQQRQHPPQVFQNHQQIQEHFHQQLQQQQQQKPQQQQRQQQKPQQQQQQEQSPPQAPVSPQRQVLHQQLVESHKLPIPKLGLRQTANQLSNSGIPRAQPLGLAQAQTSQRLRTNSDGVRGPPAPGRPHHDTWEDSTIGSLLDSERQSERDQQRMVAYEPRVDPAPQSRTHTSQAQPPTFHQERKFLPRPTHSGEHGPFILNDNGYIRSVDHSKGLNTAAPIQGNLQNSKRSEANIILDEAYADKSDAGSTPKKQLKHSKYAIRDAMDVNQNYQDAGRRRSYVEAPIYSRQEAFLNVSPERRQNASGGLPRGHTDRQSRDAGPHRSTQFFDLETAQQTPVPPDDQSDVAAHEAEAAAEQETPRLSNSKPSLSLGRDALGGYPPILTNTWPPSNGVASMPPTSFAATRQHSFPPSLAANGPYQTVAPRSNSNRKPQLAAQHQKKRRLSLDYDDHVLSRMEYTELRNESFDHDPARSAIQRANTPSSGDTLTQKLSHYQNQDENSQHHFFTQLSVSEWDECGDWFLGRFGDLVGEIKAARQEKRKIVSQYESQISAREQAVRSRAEKIEHALTSLKHEGEGMMKGKDINI